MPLLTERIEHLDTEAGLARPAGEAAMVVNVDPQALVSSAQRHLDQLVGTQPRVQQRIGDQLGDDQFGVLSSLGRKIIERADPEPRLTHCQGLGREREPVDGAATKYAQLFRAEEDDLIVNKIWARNGSVGVVTERLAGCYGSNEFPMFAPNLRQDLVNLPIGRHPRFLSMFAISARSKPASCAFAR